MDKEKLVQKLMVTFVLELEEHVTALNRDLLALEKESSTEDAQKLLQMLFRSAHSLKGASRSVGIALIESACHELEELLTSARDGVRLETQAFELIFRTIDGIQEVGLCLRNQQDISTASLNGLIGPLKIEVNKRHSAKAVQTPETTTSLLKQPGSMGSEKNDFLNVPSQLSSALHQPNRAELMITSNELSVTGLSSTSSMRIPAEKVDALLSDSSALLITSLGTEQRLTAIDNLKLSIKECFTNNKAVTQTLHRLMRNLESEAALHLEAQIQKPVSLHKHLAELLVYQREHLHGVSKQLDRLGIAMLTDRRRMVHASHSVDSKVRSLRMLPFSEACQGMDRVVRDLAKSTGKDVVLKFRGEDAEIDRGVLEKLKDPLLHLVRNCVDHGIEPIVERTASGKQTQGLITISTELRGDQIEIVVEDDGRGLNKEAILAQSRKKGFPEPSSPAEYKDMILMPGFSTSTLITEISGRGIGLDVVRESIANLHGDMDLSFESGRGTKFILTVPLTLTTVRVVLLRLSSQTFGISSANVEKTFRVYPEELESIEGKEMFFFAGNMVPTISLAQVLRLPMPEVVAGKPLQAVLIRTGEKRTVLIVDELLAEQAVVVKNLGARVKRLKHFSGTILLSSGEIGLVLNVLDLSQFASAPTMRKIADLVAAKGVQAAKRRLILVEDSFTTRSLEKSILEAAGYEVVAVADGAKAWWLLQEKGADLIVSDVDMPIMDGFVLTETVRASKRFKDLPVILVTARADDKDKARGIEVGANAYLVKSDFDQTNLLQTIRQLL